MKKIKKIIIVIFILSFAVIYTSCRKSPAHSDVAAEITLLMRVGDSKYYLDIGGQKLTPDELTAPNVATAYATAKAFKELYPNVKINLFAKASKGDSDENSPWEQQRENFRMEFGVYPDIWVSNDMIGDVMKGLVSDLSIFKDDPMYQSFNPWVLSLMNINGRQFGLPNFLIPWGVFVNKSLADANNIDVPDPDWTIDEFTRFVNHSRANEFYGLMGDYELDINLVNTGTRDFTYQLLNRKSGEPFVNIDSEANRAVLRYLSQWTANAVWPNHDQGRVSDEFMDANWWWGYKLFLEGKLLAHAGDPWMMGDAANPNPEYWGHAKITDWDVYPRPSTGYVGNNIGIVLDPFVIRNYSMDDGNPELSAGEEARLRIAWEFIKFWVGDTRAWEARANQQYRDGDTYRSCMSDCFPIVIGHEFARQMDIWYSVEFHQRFKDKNKMPGFHYVLDLWERGQFWDISVNSANNIPWYYDYEGTRRQIAYEWQTAWSAEVSGASRHDPNWLDQVYARLPQWNTFMNQRWGEEVEKLNNVLERYW